MIYRTPSKTQKIVWLALSTGSILLSFGLSVFAFGQDELFDRTLSNVGLHNNNWFIAWSISFSLATMINLEILKRKLGIKGLLGILISVLLFLILPLAILQSVIIDYRVNAVHIYLAIIFTAYGLTMIIGFIVLLTVLKTISNKRFFEQGILYFLIIAVPGLSNFWAINFFGRLTAAFQILLIYVCLITVFFMQIFERWKKIACSM